MREEDDEQRESEREKNEKEEDFLSNLEFPSLPLHGNSMQR
jgi:hypothetical protein